jgi:hypothetical protein
LQEDLAAIVKLEPLELIQEDVIIFNFPYPSFEMDSSINSTPNNRKQEKENGKTDEVENGSETKIRKKKNVSKNVTAFHCSFNSCGKLFTTKSSLVLHERVHNERVVSIVCIIPETVFAAQLVQFLYRFSNVTFVIKKLGI